jgi:hypothetical protein
VVSLKQTDVSEVSTAAIIRAMNENSGYKPQNWPGVDS